MSFKLNNGEEVEVACKEDGLQDSWFLATILKTPTTTNNNKYHIQYQHLFDERKKPPTPLKEYVDRDQLRPLPPIQTPPPKSFHLGEEVDALYNDGWWKGVVSKVHVKASRYSVFFQSFDETMVFKLPDLRTHIEWIQGKWVTSKNQGSGQSPNPTGISALDTVKDGLCKNVVSSYRGNRSNPISWPSGTTNPTDAQNAFSFPTTKGVDALDHQPMSDGRIDLRSAILESLVSSESSNVVDILSLKEYTTFGDVYQFNNVKEDERVMHPADITTNSSSSAMQHDERPIQEGHLPFTKNSPFWRTIKSDEAFQLIPQQPHFRPLEQYIEELREGFAMANTVNFSNLVKGIMKANLEEPRVVFENKLKGLSDLEAHGFTVEPLRTRLEELLRLKDNYSHLEGKSQMAEREFTEEKLKIVEVEDSITQLNMQHQNLVRERESKVSNIDELQKKVDAIKETTRIARHHFDSMVASPIIRRS